MLSIRSLVLAAVATTGFLAATSAATASEEEAVYLTMKTTMGDIVLELYPQLAPVTVANFMTYAEDGFFDDTIVHRVVPGFVIQGGGFTAEGEKKETLPPITNEWRNGLTNDRGTLSMVHTSDPNSATSQFFVNLKDNASLDQPTVGRRPDFVKGAAYAVFGRVVEGMDVVDEIAKVQTKPNPKIGGMPSPVEPVIFNTVLPPDEARAQELFASHEVDREAVLVRARERGAELKGIVQQETERAQRAADRKRKLAESSASIANVASKSSDEQRQIAIDNLEKMGHNVDLSNAEVTDSGVWYYELEAGDGVQPSPNNTVTVHYTGWFPEGIVFDSSLDAPGAQPTQLRLNRFVPGWAEGVGKMKQGGKCLLIIPGSAAYGPNGRATIPGNATLVFEVELLDVK